MKGLYGKVRLCLKACKEENKKVSVSKQYSVPDNSFMFGQLNP